MILLYWDIILNKLSVFLLNVWYYWWVHIVLNILYSWSIIHNLLSSLWILGECIVSKSCTITWGKRLYMFKANIINTWLGSWGLLEKWTCFMNTYEIPILYSWNSRICTSWGCVHSNWILNTFLFTSTLSKKS